MERGFRIAKSKRDDSVCKDVKIGWISNQCSRICRGLHAVIAPWRVYIEESKIPVTFSAKE